MAYLRRLLTEAFWRLVPSAFDKHHLDRVTREAASAEITRLKSVLAERRRGVAS